MPADRTDSDSQRNAEQRARATVSPTSPKFADTFQQALESSYTDALRREHPGAQVKGPLFEDVILKDARLFQSLQTMLQRTQIWLGKKVPPGGYPQVVAVRSRNGAHVCTGTLVASNAVLTAAHCKCEGAFEEVVFGDSISQPAGQTRPVLDSSVMMPATCEPAAWHQDDIAIAFIAWRPFQAVQPVAKPEWVPTIGNVSIVGYGETESGSTGSKLFADVAVVSRDCSGAGTGQRDAAAYGCVAGREMVAGGYLRADTCFGDSGGPVLVTASDNQLYLAATTSRSVRPEAGCGFGAIYELLDARRLQWISDHHVSVKIGT